MQALVCKLACYFVRDSSIPPRRYLGELLSTYDTHGPWSLVINLFILALNLAAGGAPFIPTPYHHPSPCHDSCHLLPSCWRVFSVWMCGLPPASRISWMVCVVTTTSTPMMTSGLAMARRTHPTTGPSRSPILGGLVFLTVPSFLPTSVY